ncbi:MAG TPA: 2-oxo acid dehydrogenase subunit E2 [Vicinamibacterales bacterium]|jgi:pyruvate dehydrogenase E2 component (dihydrolipoamide acetyltransferase)|nr:2-oxo acid dehydrogenase subunit E2 [Vicinamibacterales bacterium]
MADFILPELGENVTAGDVVRILVKPGDAIAKDQPVLELETDKATIEVPSSVAGTVRDVKVKQGDKVKVGQAILSVEENQGASATPPEPEPQSMKGAASGALAQRDTTGPTPGPAEEAEDAEAGRDDRESTKPGTVEVGRAAAPRLPEDVVEDVSEKGKARQRRGEVVNISREPRAPQPEVSEGPAPAAGPSVRRIARELGVDIRQVPGTGPGGRITVEDVQLYVRQALAGAAESGGAPASAPSQPLPDFSKWGDVERKPVSNIRRKTAEHLGHAWNTIPHVTQHDKADITALEALRKEYSPQAERAGGRLTVTAIALKIVAGALRKFPQFTAAYDTERGQLVYRRYSGIGVAVDTDRGLLVPVIRDVNTKGIIELSVELTKASEKARAGKLSLDDMSGGVTTITNLGGIGGTAFTPIVNWPEAAILGISRGAHEPVWNGSTFEPRLMLPLSLSYDHRIIDGADAARFLRWVAEAFEQPFVLAL